MMYPTDLRKKKKRGIAFRECSMALVALGQVRNETRLSRMEIDTLAPADAALQTRWMISSTPR